MRSLFTSVVVGTAVLSPLQLLLADPPKTNHPVAAVQDTETKDQRDARMGWWRKARFGMFIHWGLYAEPAGKWNDKPVGGIGEWIMHNAKIPVTDYQALTKTFNPTKFNADDWVALAKKAGMKYMVITSKHHDGFAMYHSEVIPFNIYDATPFKRDPLKELAAACDKQDMKFGFYYSQAQDWTAVGGGAIGGHWDKAQDGDFADYIHKKAIPQIHELLNNYKPYPAVLWFDTPVNMSPELAADIVKELNTRPELIWNNRLGGGYKGDTETPEQKIPPQGYPGEDWETCMTINNTWGYKTDDLNFKSTETLLKNLVDIASKGGNFLLNVGPDATGVIPQQEQDRLLEIGKWLDVNGESIYGCGSTPFGAECGEFAKADGAAKPKFIAAWDWRCTTQPGKLYFHLLKWPGATFQAPVIKEKVTGAYMLADSSKKALKFEQNDKGLTVTLPDAAPDPLDSVLVVTTATP